MAVDEQDLLEIGEHRKAERSELEICLSLLLRTLVEVEVRGRAN